MFLDDGCFSDTFYGSSHSASAEPAAVQGKQEIIRFLRRALRYPLFQEGFYLRMKRDIPVVMHFTQRHTEPVVFAYLDYTVGGKIEEFTLAHAGHEESNAAQPGKQIRMLSCCLEEFRCGYLIQKFRRRCIQDREIPGKYEYPRGRFRPLPLRDANKEIIQGCKEMILVCPPKRSPVVMLDWN